MRRFYAAASGAKRLRHHRAGLDGDRRTERIYIVDRADTGLHILELSGEARAIAKF